MEKEENLQDKTHFSDVGQILIDAREARGYSAEDIAASLKLRPRQIAALEAGEFEKLSGMTYTRGIIRNYAKLVDIDPEPLLAQLKIPEEIETLESNCLTSEALSAIDMSASSSMNSSLSWRPNRLLIVIAAIAVILGVVIWALPEAWPERAMNFASEQSTKAMGWWQSFRQDSDSIPVETEEALPMNVEPEVPEMPTSFLPAEATLSEFKIPDEENNRLMGRAVSSPTPISTANLKMVFKDDAWVEIKETRSKKVIFSGFIPSGSEREFTAGLPTELKIGNARAVDVTFNGSQIALSSYTQQGAAHLLLQ